jgi:heme exporter protein CcmB
MQIFLLIFQNELVISLRHFAKILANFLFFLISVAIFSLISQNQDSQDFHLFYSITIIWFSLLSCLIFSATEFLKKDFDDGTIEQILTSVENFEIFVLAKMLANWLVCSLPILISALPIGLAIGLNANLALHFLALLLLASLAINFICTFCGSLSVLGNSAPMIATIALPLIIPILLIAFGGTFEEPYVSLKILLGLVVFIGSVAVFATARIVRIAAE